MKRRVPRLQGVSKRFGKGELIGLDAVILRSTDATMVGRKGAVIDETLHTVTLQDAPGGRRMQISKVGNVFGLRSDPERDWVEVDGAAIEFRSEDRTKKVR